MKILFIDESGVPDLSATSPFFILCGVLMEEDDVGHFRFMMQRIKQKYKLDLNKHIHTTDIFERKPSPCFLGKTLKRKTKDLRKKFQEEVWDLIKTYKVEYFVVCVPKDFVKNSLGLSKKSDEGMTWIKSPNYYARVDRQLPMHVGINRICHWALKKIKHDDFLKIIFESRSSSDSFTIRNFDHSTSTNVYKGAHMIKFATDLKDRVVSNAFANKSVQSAGLELADFIAYTCNVYFLQAKRSLPTKVNAELKNAIQFKGIHKTLNSRHYEEMSARSVKKYIPGIVSRTKRITTYYRRIPSGSRKRGSPDG